ncbi:DNA primase [Paenibacillus alginolyticus]|uniref:DNA primase n=1 Tax=Paenibacillus alginolyticus TaxID=59839 RepID=A0ABT4GK40_9BACL|nr:DNA primase [Paenibacillus alginolyticus]MCY9669125.1 DNA primase [Paenibacillus alginolyticus]MCY9696567.1 DNA primase [Paenibacillus alginolyticus]MEC0145750.1 DNA primase [Paenibacillus alginolyticus]
MRYGRIPEEVIEAVLKRHDIVDVIGRHVHLSKQGHYMKGLCPFHSEKSPSFTVTPEKQIYRCFGCNVGGNLIRFVMEIEGLSFSEAVSKLAEEADIPITWEEATEEQTEQQQEKATLLKAYDFTAKLYHYILGNTEQGKVAKGYLASRGISDKLIDTFQIGYAPAMWDTLVQQLDKREFDLALMEKGGLISAKHESNGYVDKFRERIMFPICDSTGKVIAFGGRSMGDAQPKYLNSPESILFNKSRTMYNLHLARPNMRKLQQAVLFEGYVDVIKAWEAGISNGVATMGTALTKEHAALLNRNADQIVVCYDGDNAGQSAAFKSIPILEETGSRVTVAMLPDGKDPDDYVRNYGFDRFVREIIEPAVPSMKYKLLYIRKNFKLHEDGDRLRYLQSAVKLISQLQSPMEREHYLKQLASEFPESSYEAMKLDLHEILLQSEKNRPEGDNKPILWNNVMNNGRTAERTLKKSPSLLPAYHNAERLILAVMMHDREVCSQVEAQLGDQFNVEAHAVLAAYLYAYYAQNAEPDASRYIAMLQDEQLESLASSIVMMGAGHGMNEQVIDDYIRQIRKVPMQEEVERKKEERVRAERAGDHLRAAQIATEIIALEKRLKST